MKKRFLLHRVNWIIHDHKGSVPNVPTDSWWLWMSHCEIFQFFFPTVMDVSSNLTLYCCDQDSAHVLIGKCHGKCFWEGEREGICVLMKWEVPSVLFIRPRNLKEYIYTCQLLSNVDGIVCYFSLWDFISCGFPCQESCSIFPAHCWLQVSWAHSFQYCVCSSMWCLCTVQYCFCFEHRFWRNLCILSSTGLSKDLPYYRSDALELWLALSFS